MAQINSNQTLQQRIRAVFGETGIAETDIPAVIKDNLKFDLRPYQMAAFRHFLLFIDPRFKHQRKAGPQHLLFNMATGSGKTLIMAGLIPYFYDRGWRNFLFFVDKTNIVLKTKQNFLNPRATKYLYQDRIIINGRPVEFREVDNFSQADDHSINIQFTTIQQLHESLMNARENSLTWEDFSDHKVIMIADEAHHLSAGTKASQKSMFDSWENTVLRIFSSNDQNYLLEFTATIDYNNQNIASKYNDKLLFRYDLRNYHRDRYSKEIKLFRSEANQDQRILLAVIINLYRQKLATAAGINLKPVILFKAKRTIDESEQNKANFHRLIDSLTADSIEAIRLGNDNPVVDQAFRFFAQSQDMNSPEKIVAAIKDAFAKAHCLSANNAKESDAKQQIKLNSLEDDDNPIRAIFAVQKLNEGWDVLNLFDIVRLYGGRDSTSQSGKLKPGKTTIAEAQLIGRGARYFPFRRHDDEDRYRRKFDRDLENPLRILEELYYHTIEDSRYISELRQALEDVGIYDQSAKELPLKLKPQFKDSGFYKSGQVVSNRRQPRDYDRNDLFTQAVQYFQVSPFAQSAYNVPALVSQTSLAFSESVLEKGPVDRRITTKSVAAIPAHVVRYVFSSDRFFHFDNLKKYIPALKSTTDLITKPEYGLANTEIKFSHRRHQGLGHDDYIAGLRRVLENLKNRIQSQDSDYEGSTYESRQLKDVITEKSLKVSASALYNADRCQAIVDRSPWYVFERFYGTSEEVGFLETFAQELHPFLLEQGYIKDSIYLVRNERHLKIIDSVGRAVEPDFILFCRHRQGQGINQTFIEPKGRHLVAIDRWKEDFLRSISQSLEIRDGQQTVGGQQYFVFGLPFYQDLYRRRFVIDFKRRLAV